MFKAFSQHTYKIFFQINYKNYQKFEEFFENSEALSTTMLEISSNHIEAQPEDIWEFSALFVIKPKQALIDSINQFAAKHNIHIASKIDIELIKDQDWLENYQANLKPIIIGNFFIAARSKKDDCPRDKIGIFMDASRAFGTGEHQTTKSCILALKHLQNENFKNILDIGTGSGILSFTAEKLWPEAIIYGCDIECVAVEIAKENGRFNDSKVIFYESNEHDISLSQYTNHKQDLIVANILANPLIELAPAIGELLAAGGYIILAGFLNDQEVGIMKAYSAQNFVLVKRFSFDNSWLTLLLRIKEN